MQTRVFINTRGLGTFPDDLCPLGASRAELDGVPRVAAALDSGESAVCFDAPGHGVSPGSHATMREYTHATHAVLQRFPSIHTIVAHSFAAIAAVSAVVESDHSNVRNLLLLAPACSLSGVLERWAAQRGIPPALVKHIHRDLERRDGMPVPHRDVRTLGLPKSVRVRILHDPADDVVPVLDAHEIAAHVSAEIDEAAGTGHYKIIGSDHMRAAIANCLQPAA